MGIGKRIKEAREKLGLTQNELASLIGVTSSAITNYEKETSHPKEPIMYKLIDALKVDANYLFQDAVNISIKTNDITLSEYEHIKKYRNLDNYGKETVDITLERESERVRQLRDLDEQVAKLQTYPGAVVEFSDYPGIVARTIQYFYSASAGTGQVIFDDVFSERITIPDLPEYRRVAYALKVSGRSMEPLYHDGDMLLIEPTCEISIGEIGIFNVDGQAFVKKLGENKLISLNTGYDDIPLTRDSKCMGRVIDKFSI